MSGIFNPEGFNYATLDGNTSGVLDLVSSGTLTLAGGANITLSQAGNAITLSGASQSAQTQNVVDLTLSGNTSGVMALISSGTATIAGGNNITLSQAGNAFTISAFNQSVQTQSRFNLTLSGNSTSAGAGFILVSSGVLTLAGGPNITLSQNGNAISISGGAGGGGGGVNIAASDTTYTSGTVSFTGVGGGITVSSNTGQRVDLSVLPAPMVTLAGNSTSAGAGFALVSTGTLTLAGGNNITLSQNGNAVTISAFTQTVQTQSRFNLTVGGNSTSAGAGFIEVSSGTLTLAGGNNITLSQNGNAITISGAAGGGGATRSWFWNELDFTVTNSIGNASFSLMPIRVLEDLSVTRGIIEMSYSNSTSQTASTAAVSISMVIYTLVNSTSLGSATSGSQSYSWTSGTAASNDWGGYRGRRQFTSPLNAAMTPGNYVVGLWVRTTNANMGGLFLIGGQTQAYSGYAGQLSSVGTNNRAPFLGLYTASTSVSPPSGIAASQISGAGASSAHAKQFFFEMRNV